MTRRSRFKKRAGSLGHGEIHNSNSSTGLFAVGVTGMSGVFRAPSTGCEGVGVLSCSPLLQSAVSYGSGVLEGVLALSLEA